MALSTTYYTDNDVTFPDVTTAANVCKSFLLRLKQLMAGQTAGTNGPDGAPPVGSRWTVVSSSDSVTADATDRWTTISNVVRAASGAHSWIVLQSPAAIGSYQVCIDYLSASDAALVVAYSKTGFTGGTTSLRPTATDEVASATAQTTIGVTTAGALHRLSRVTDADGNFHVVHITAGSATGFHTVFGVKKLAGASSLDQYQVGFFWEYLATGRGAMGTVAGSGPIYSFSSSVAGGWFQRATDGSAGTPDNTRGSGVCQPHAASGITYSYLASTSADSGSGRYYGFPAKVWTCHSAGLKVADRGIIADFYIGNSGPSVGTAEPASGVPERICVGNFWMPCGGVAPLL